MPLANDPNKHAPGSEGKWGDFVGSVGDPIPLSPAQKHSAQLSVVEIGGRFDPAVSKELLSMLGIDMEVKDEHDRAGNRG